MESLKLNASRKTAAHARSRMNSPSTAEEMWGRLSEVVGEALALPAGERAEYLAATCRLDDGSLDRSLLKAASEMIAASERADDRGALRSPVSGLAAVVADSESLRAQEIPLRIGPWKPTRRLGAGGMGVVYAAVRDDATFEQHAAVKLVHPGFARDFEERFVHERKVLAGLNHPGVARLLDGGRTADGAPYLAMELVDGEPLTAYARSRNLTVRQRLKLFLQACDAVAYAHQNLVVHRDLKPAHVLVADSAQPRIKLLDFGVAKLIEGGGDALTRTVGGPMTAAYAAPEQLLFEPVTTATDVYSLGLVLFELLVGSRPYDISNLTASETEQVVTGYSPPAPSLASSDPAIARVLRGDVDQVVLKAMSKEPHRRYPSAAALGDDIRRYLNGQPVLAQPDTLSYRLSKVVARNRVSVITGSLALVVVTILAVVFTLGLASERNRARLAAADAIENAERAEAVSEFLERVLRAPNENWYVDGKAKGPDTPIRAVLAEAQARIEKDFVDRPDIRADLHHILGDTYMSLRMVDETRAHHERALEIRREIYEAPHPKIAEALYYVALVQQEEWQTMVYLREAVQMQLQRNEGNNFPFMVQSLALGELALGNVSRADSLTLWAYEFADRTFVAGSEAARYRPAMVWLAAQRSWIMSVAGREDQALRWLERADSSLARLPTEATNYTLWYQNQMTRGIYYASVGRYAEAEDILGGIVESDPSRVGTSPFPRPDGTDVGDIRRNWAAVYLVWLAGESNRAAPETHTRLADRHHARVEAMRAGLRRQRDTTS